MVVMSADRVTASECDGIPIAVALACVNFGNDEQDIDPESTDSWTGETAADKIAWRCNEAALPRDCLAAMRKFGRVPDMTHDDLLPAGWNMTERDDGGWTVTDGRARGGGHATKLGAIRLACAFDMSRAKSRLAYVDLLISERSTDG